MRKFNVGLNVFAAAVLLGMSTSAFAHHDYGMDAAAFVANDPPGNFLPGQYFQYKAQFYLKKQDYAEALRLFELSGFWANKIAQYNAGLMYYNGIGIPVDRVRGVAWLGIAAEAHGDLALRALEVAYASLSSEEKRRASDLFNQLDEKYGDAVAVPRALNRFDREARNIVGSRVGSIGNVTMYETGPGGNGSQGEPGAAYFRRQIDTRDQLIERITGRVTVGAVAPLKVSADALRSASQVPLDQPVSN
jgi:TPR repeat protein